MDKKRTDIFDNIEETKKEVDKQNAIIDEIFDQFAINPKDKQNSKISLSKLKYFWQASGIDKLQSGVFHMLTAFEDIDNSQITAAEFESLFFPNDFQDDGKRNKQVDLVDIMNLFEMIDRHHTGMINVDDLYEFLTRAFAFRKLLLTNKLKGTEAKSSIPELAQIAQIRREDVEQVFRLLDFKHGANLSPDQFFNLIMAFRDMDDE